MRLEHIDRLFYEVSSKFAAAITPAGARALLPSPDEDRSIEWSLDALSGVSLDSEEITGFDDLDFERFHGVGIAFS